MKISVLDLSGKEKGAVELNDGCFARSSDGTTQYYALKAEEANRRVGTAAAKGRSDVSGGGKKPWRQKGLGRARAGTRTSPLWRGGGVVFGPVPRSYRQNLPRKQRRVACMELCSRHLKEGRFLIVEDFSLEIGKTKELVEKLHTLKKENRVLLLLKDNDQLVKRAARNLPWLHYNMYNCLSVHELAYARQVICMKSAAEQLNSLWGGSNGTSS